MSEPTWRDSLPEDIRSDATLATIPDVGTLAKNFIATKALVGRKSYDLPRDDWKPEQWQEWHKTLGVPEKPDAYPLPEATVLEKAGLPVEVIKTAAGKFHELGLTPRQAKGLLDWYTSDATKGAETAATQAAAEKVAAENALKQEFGDAYPAKMGLVKAFLSKYGSPELIAWAEETGAGNNPAFVRSLIKAGEALLEDSSRRGVPVSPGAEAAFARIEIEQMKAQRLTDKAYSAKFEDAKSPERIRWNQLHDVAYAQSKVA